MVLPPWDCHSELYSSSSTLTFGKQASWIAATLLLHPTEMTTAPFHPFSKTPALGPASEEKSLHTMSQKSTGVRWRRVQTVPAQYHAHEGLPPPQEGELHYPPHAELHLLWKQLTTAKPRLWARLQLEKAATILSSSHNHRQFVVLCPSVNLAPGDKASLSKEKNPGDKCRRNASELLWARHAPASD